MSGLFASSCAWLWLLCGSVCAQPSPGSPAQRTPLPGGWYALFDGKTLSGWDNWGAGDWKMTSVGVLRGQGKPSILWSPNAYRNFVLKAVVSISSDGNSGIFFRAEPKGERKRPDFEGYEAQISNSDPQKTGSLYNFVIIKERLAPDDKWFSMHVAAVGNRIIIQVNDKIVVDYVDEKETYKSGRIGLQNHHEGSVVMFREVLIRPLPPDEGAAALALRQVMPELK